jgi:hypothetical protein
MYPPAIMDSRRIEMQKPALYATPHRLFYYCQLPKYRYNRLKTSGVRKKATGAEAELRSFSSFENAGGCAGLRVQPLSGKSFMKPRGGSSGRAGIKKDLP